MKNLISVRNNPWSIFLNDNPFRVFDDLNCSSGIIRDRPEFLKYEVEETDKCLPMSFDLPGVKSEDLKVEIEDKVLTISGERKNELKKEGYSERFYGSFKRSFSLPDEFEHDKIEAQYEDGVLKLALPKAPTKAVKKIEISVGENAKGFFSKFLGQSKEKNVA